MKNMQLKKIRLDKDYIYGTDAEGKEYRQSLLWYPRLQKAGAAQRKKFTLSPTGIHWRELDEDISFESFFYEDAEPTPMQDFFLRHKEINIAEFAARIGINAYLLRNYINGFKKPSKQREQLICDGIKNSGKNILVRNFEKNRKFTPWENFSTSLARTTGSRKA